MLRLVPLWHCCLRMLGHAPVGLWRYQANQSMRAPEAFTTFAIFHEIRAQQRVERLGTERLRLNALLRQPVEDHRVLEAGFRPRR